MSQDKEWSNEKLMICLKRIVHPEFLPSISEEEFDLYNHERFEEVKALDFLRFIYEKSKGKLRIYGTVEEMMESFKQIDQIPEFIASNESVDSLSSFALAAPFFVYNEPEGKPAYTSRSSMAILVFKCLTICLKGFRITDIAGLFFRTWLTAFLNQTLRRLKGSYDLIPSSSRNLLSDELESFVSYKPELTSMKGIIDVEWFHDLKIFFEQEEQPFLTQTISRLEPEAISTNQEYYKKEFEEIVFLIENTKEIFERHIKLFTPSKDVMIDEKPPIRLLILAEHSCLFAQEVNLALRQLMNKQYVFSWISYSQVAEDLIVVESEEERKNGIVYSIRPSKFLEILKTLHFSLEHLVILQDFCYTDYRYLTLPIISSYGTHCIPAADAFDNIIYYLTVILKVFQRCTTENLQEVLQWIDDMMDPVFVGKPVIYMVEVWKIDEIIDRARRELSHLLTEPEYEVPFKETYTKNEAFREIAKLTENCKMDRIWFIKSIDQLMNWMTLQTIDFKTVYYGYNQMIIYYLQENSLKVRRLVDTQCDHDEKKIYGFEKPNSAGSKKEHLNKNAPSPRKQEFIQRKEEIKNFRDKQLDAEVKLGFLEPEDEASSGSKKGLLNENVASPKKQESDQKEEVQKPSCSNENDENREQQFAEELEKLQKNENELEEELEKKREDLKQEVDSENDLEEPNSVCSEETLFDENEVPPKKRRLDQKEEEVQEPSFSIENDENRARRVAEELEKLEKDKNELEEELEKEIVNLKTAVARSEKAIEMLRQKLEKIEEAKIQLESDRQSEIEKITADFEERVQKDQEELEKFQGSWSLRLAMYLLKGEKEKETGKNIDLENESRPKQLKKQIQKFRNMKSRLENLLKVVEAGCEEAKQEIEKHQESESQQEEKLKTSHEMATQMTDSDKMLKEEMDELEESQNLKEDDETSDNGWVLLDDEKEKEKEKKIELEIESSLRKLKSTDFEGILDSVLSTWKPRSNNSKYAAEFQRKIKEPSETHDSVGRACYYAVISLLKEAKSDFLKENPEEEFEIVEEE